MNLGAEPRGLDTYDKRNPLLGRGGHAVSLYPPLVDAGANETGIIANRLRSCGLRLRIAHSWQSYRMQEHLGWCGSKGNRTVKAEETPLIP